MKIKTNRIIRTNISSILIVILVLTTLGGIIINKLFNPPDSNPMAYTGNELIPSKYIDNLFYIEIKNSNGVFVLEYLDLQWKVFKDKSYIANEEIIQQIKNSLYNIGPLKELAFTDNNADTFSINNPVVELKLKSKEFNDIMIYIGIINPIDNTSYVSINRKSIFQITSLTTQFDKIDLSVLKK